MALSDSLRRLLAFNNSVHELQRAGYILLIASIASKCSLYILFPKQYATLCQC